MSKFIPSATPEITLTPGSVKGAAKQAEGKQQEMFMVPPASLVLIDGFNLRITGTPEYDAGIRAIADSIKVNGFYRDKPFSVIAQKQGDPAIDVFAITDGHRRFAALNLAIEEGVVVEAVPVVPVRNGTSLEDATIAMMQTGEPLSPYERAIGVARLSKAGLDDDMIAKRLGVSKTYVGDMHALMSMPAKTRKLVMDGKVAAGAAVKAFKADPKTAHDRLTAAVEKGAERGKNKASPRDIKPADKPASSSNRGRKPNPLRTEFDFEAKQDDEVSLTQIEPYRAFGGGTWFTLSENEGMAIIVQDVRIKGVCVLKEPLPGSEQSAPAAPTTDVSDL